MKEHDFNILMQKLLPVALHHVLPKVVWNTICRLCLIYRQISEKMVDPSDLENLEDGVMKILWLLEKYVPPSFFDILIHLIVHLVLELWLCGPIAYGWMYPFERLVKLYYAYKFTYIITYYVHIVHHWQFFIHNFILTARFLYFFSRNMNFFKSYVRNKNMPKGCIALNYTVEESIKFCAKYVETMEYIGRMPSRNGAWDEEEGEVAHYGTTLSSGTFIPLDSTSFLQARRWFLQNTDEVQPWIE